MRPQRRFSDSIHIVSSDVFVVPRWIAPVARSRAAVDAVSLATSPLRATTPAVSGAPSTAIDSLIVHGTPWKRGRSPPAATCSSAASASASASSKRSRTMAPRAGSRLRRTSMWACTTSRELTSPAAIARARSVAERSPDRGCGGG